MNQGYLFIFAATVLFSTMEIALKSVAGMFNPVQVNFTRFLIGGLVLIPFALRALRGRGVSLDARALWGLAGLGFIGVVVSMTFYQLAVEYANASVVAVLFSCNPVFVLIFAAFLLGTPVRREHIIALVLECIGILLLSNPFANSVGYAGILFVLLSALTFALYAVLGTRMCSVYSGVVVTCGSFLFAALEMGIFIILSHCSAVAQPLMAVGLDMFANISLTTGYTGFSALVMLYVCVGVSGAGYASYFMAMEKTSPMTASLVFFFKPALAPILAWLVLHEPIPLTMVLGICSILLGSMVSLRPRVPLAMLDKLWKRGREQGPRC